MEAHEIRLAQDEGRSIQQDGWSFVLQKPDWTPNGQSHVAGFGEYLDWAGMADSIVRDLSGPDKVIVIVRGPNGAGKDHLAAEVAWRLRIPYHLTVLEPDTSSTSLICFPLLPIERGVFALSPHTTAQATGGLSCITEGGKGDHRFSKVMAPQASAYDDHRVVKCNQPPVHFAVHPDHSLLILALPGEDIQKDIESRAAHYDLELPPPEALMSIVKAKSQAGVPALLDALREYVSDQWASGKPMPPRSAITALAIAHKEYTASGPAGRLSAREARRIVDRSVGRVRF